MAFLKTKPLDNDKLKLTPAWLRDNWQEIEYGSVWSGVSTAGFMLKSTGSSSAPVWGLPENLQIASQAQGTILYYSGSAWVVLAVGTNGNILKTQGAGANPAWTDTAPKASDLTIGSQAQGDILYFNGTNWVRLGAGTAGYYLKTQGAGANPTWAALGAATDLSMTGQEQGDIVYFNGTNWVVLHHGTSGQVLQSGGHAANPSWVSSLVSGGFSILDYGTSNSSSTQRGNASGTIKIAYGVVQQSSGSFTISNLPFSSSTSFMFITNRESNNSNIVSQYQSQAIEIWKTSSTVSGYDNLGGSKKVDWVAIGT